MTWLSRLFGRREKPMAPSGPVPDRVFLFHGSFETELAVTEYCLDGDFARDLGRKVPLDHVEIIFGDRVPHALPMIHPRPATRGANALVMFSADSADGLKDTGRLTFAGEISVT